MDPQDNSDHHNELDQYLFSIINQQPESTATIPAHQQPESTATNPPHGFVSVQQQPYTATSVNPPQYFVPAHQQPESTATNPPHGLARKPRGRPRKETVVDVPYLHSIDVNVGENIVAALSAFAQQQQTGTNVSVLSVVGSINSGTLNRIGNVQGEHTILCMSGDFRLSEMNVLTGRLIVSLLASSDGRIFGGNVTGPLMASSPVTISVMISHPNGKGSNSTPPPSKKARRGAPSPSSSTPLLL